MADRPVLIQFHDYRTYLKTALSFLIEKREYKSLREVARAAKISPAYLVMILKGSRNLSQDGIQKLAPIFHWSQDEIEILTQLCLIADSEVHAVRMSALAKIQASPKYSQSNPNELESYQYLSRWFYPVIRQLSKLPSFEPKPEWIQKQLRERVSISEIREGLDFLFDKGYLKKLSNGNVERGDRKLGCDGGVFRIALGQFHHELLTLASKAIEQVPRSERSITAEMFPISQQGFNRLQEKIQKVVKQAIEEEMKKAPPEVIYNVSIAAFPLTQPKTTAKPIKRRKNK